MLINNNVLQSALPNGIRAYLILIALKLLWPLGNKLLLVNYECARFLGLNSDVVEV